MNQFLAVPAYGREYTSVKAVKADWDAGKDFLLVGMGQRGYINKEDTERLGVPGNEIKIRFAQNTKFVFITVRKGGNP